MAWIIGQIDLRRRIGHVLIVVIIDPCGNIVCQLPAQAGVLRSNLKPGVKVR